MTQEAILKKQLAQSLKEVERVTDLAINWGCHCNVMRSGELCRLHKALNAKA